MKVSLIQQGSFSENKNKNISESCELVRQACELKPDLVILPELHCSRYFCQTENTEYFDLADEISEENKTCKIFSDLAKELNIVLVTSLFERRAKGLYHNTAVVFERNGHIAGKYRKMHIPDDPDYYEKYYFTLGDLGFKPIKTSIGNLGILICWDQWFPEASRVMALNGADILIFPTAIGWKPTDSSEEKEAQVLAWKNIQISHSIANGLPVLSVNRTGFEENTRDKNGTGIDFWGNSFISNSHGKVLRLASNNSQEILSAEIDLNETEKTRRLWPFFRDRRIDEYKDLLKKWAE